MKKLLFPTVLIIMSLILVACGDDEEVTDPNLDDTGDSADQTTEDGQQDDSGAADEETNETATDETETSSEEGTQDEGTDLQDRYNFIEFNLEVDIDNQDEAVDVEFDAEPNDTEAKYVDQTQDIDLRGDEAIEELDSIFSNFGFDDQSTDDEIINEVLEAFNIPETATEIDLDIEFSSGVEKEFDR